MAPQAAAATSSRRADPPFALLVDPDADTRHMYAQYLRQGGIESEEAADGREALAKALSRSHDIVITETRLMGINGFQLCQLLRTDPATSTTAIVVVTGDGFAGDVNRARSAGADSVLVKPCLPEVLFGEIRRLVQRSAELTASARPPRPVADEAVKPLADPERAHTRTLSRTFSRFFTVTPPNPPPVLVCPTCDRPLLYRNSHIGGVSERHMEQWDYYECSAGCGTFQYRQRTRKLQEFP